MLYGVKIVGMSHPLTLSIEPKDFYVNYILSENDDLTWTTRNRSDAEALCAGSCTEESSTVTSPYHSYEPDHLEVVVLHY